MDGRFRKFFAFNITLNCVELRSVKDGNETVYDESKLVDFFNFLTCHNNQVKSKSILNHILSKIIFINRTDTIIKKNVFLTVNETSKSVQIDFKLLSKDFTNTFDVIDRILKFKKIKILEKNIKFETISVEML